MAGHAQTDAVPARRLTATERRRQLISVALPLFAERGFGATTMDDIAEVAGVTKPLVYQHFSSKRALYLELVDTVARVLISEIEKATGEAEGPRQQVELGFAAYFRLVVTHEDAFLLLYGRDNRDPELNEAQRRVENAIAEAIDPLIDAGLEPEHRRFLAYAVIGMAEGASRHWVATQFRAQSGSPAPDAEPTGPVGVVDPESEAEALRLASRIANLAWAGLRSVHAD